jgi:hypothetical protein
LSYAPDPKEIEQYMQTNLAVLPGRPAKVYERKKFLDIEPPTRRWVIKRVIPAVGVGFVVGTSRAGKTFVALDACLKIAAAAPKVWGRRASQCGVIYAATEDPDGCEARVKAWRLAKRRTSPMPFELLTQPINLLNPDDIAALKTSLRAAVAEMDAEDYRLGVLAIDTLSRAIPGVDENNSLDMSRALEVLFDIAREFELFVLVVAHHGKSGADKGIRGWSGLDSNSDATITVERDPDDPDMRTLSFSKVKNGLDGVKIVFSLEQVSLGTFDEDGDEETSCVPRFDGVVAGGATPRTAKRGPLQPHEKVVLVAIQHVTGGGVTHPIPMTVKDPKLWWKAVTVEDVRARAKVSGLSIEGDKRNTVNVRFNRALERLVAREMVRVEGDYVWTI